MHEDHYPSLRRERFTTTFDNVSYVNQRKLLETDILSYQVGKQISSQAAISTTNAIEIELCSKEYFSSVILSSPVNAQLFPDNIIVVNWCPFEPLRSNIDHMLQESDEMFVEKCVEDALPRSFSFGTFSPRAKIRAMAGCSLHRRSRPF